MAERKGRRRSVRTHSENQSSLQVLVEQNYVNSSTGENNSEKQREQIEIRESDSKSNDGNITLDHLIQTSIDLDEVAKRNVQTLIKVGSKRFARELIEMLENASKAIEQNANLLKILHYHLNGSEGAKDLLEEGDGDSSHTL